MGEIGVGFSDASLLVGHKRLFPIGGKKGQNRKNQAYIGPIALIRPIFLFLTRISPRHLSHRGVIFIVRDPARISRAPPDLGTFL